MNSSDGIDDSTSTTIDHQRLEDEKKEDEPYLKEEEVACIDKNILQAVFGNLMKKVQQVYPIYSSRRNIIIDIDRVLIDIIEQQNYERLLSLGYRNKLNAYQQDIKQHKIEFMNIKFHLAIRKDSLVFLHQLSYYFDIYLMTFLQKDLVDIILKCIDPESKVFHKSRAKRIMCIQPNQQGYFSSNEKRLSLIQNSLEYNSKDVVIIDRSERVWACIDHDKLILIKTFAPLSGVVVQEPHLQEIPLYFKYGHGYSSNAESCTSNDKYHLTTLEECQNENTLVYLKDSLIRSYQVQQQDEEYWSIKQQFDQRFGLQYAGKSFSQDYIYGQKISKSNPNNLSLREKFIIEVVNRLGGILNKQNDQSPDFYIILDESTSTTEEAVKLKESNSQLITVQQIINYFLRIRMPQAQQVVPHPIKTKKRVVKQSTKTEQIQ